MKALITGIAGFVGSHLAEYILYNHPAVTVFGAVRTQSNIYNIEHIRKDISLFDCNLMDPLSVRKILTETKPDLIFHLAAQSYVADSWKDPAGTFSNNLFGQLNVFEGVKALGLSAHILVAGSSEEYGSVYENEPIKEDNSLRPVSPYAASKVGQDFLGYQYFNNFGMHIIRTRAFNHSGPRRGEQFAESNFAKQLAEISLGRREHVIYVGNLTPKRDFTDVRDIVRAYWLALDNGTPGDVYNICSGKAYSIQEILDKLLIVSDMKVQVKEDPARFRPSDTPILIGDNTKLKNKTGWTPQIPFKQTLRDIFQYWLSRLSTN